MIPKTIHYCWFGGKEKNDTIRECINSWKTNCPDFDIIEWNEDNTDIEGCPKFVRDAYKAKKWAFVSDYVRLKIIFNQGGIYLDTDVKVLKNLGDLLGCRSYFGLEETGRDTHPIVNTGLGFGAEKGSLILQELMCQYELIEFPESDGDLRKYMCTEIAGPVFLKYGFSGKDVKQIIQDDVVIYPIKYFGSYNHYAGEASINHEDAYSLHLYDSSWVNNTEYAMNERMLCEKYGYKRWKSGRAHKIEDFWSDSKQIRVEHSFLRWWVWIMIHIWVAYFF